MDKTQKLILAIGTTLVLAVIFYYFTAMKPGTKPVENNTEFEVPGEKLAAGEKPNYEKDLLATIRSKNDYERNKENEERKYGVDDRFFKDEFYVEKNNDEETDSLAGLNEGPEKAINENQVKKEVVVKYVTVEKEKEKKPLEPKIIKRENKKLYRDRFYASGKGRANEKEETANTMVTVKGFVPGVIMDELDLRSGNPVNIRLMESTEFGGVKLTKDYILTGVASVSRDRVFIVVNAVKVNGNLKPVNIEIFDLNGLKGLGVPGGVDKNIRGGVINDAINETGRRSNLPVVGKVLVGSAKKKANDPSIRVIRGYKVLLKES